MKEVGLGTPASCLGEEILLHSWLGNTYEKLQNIELVHRSCMSLKNKD